LTSNAVFAIAKREFLENIHARHVVILTLVYSLLILMYDAVVYQDFLDALHSVSIYNSTIQGMPALAPNDQLLGGLVLFLSLGPLFVISTSFGVFSHERSSKSLSLLLSQPISRSSVFAGKVVGLTLVFVPLVATPPVLAITASLASVGEVTVQLVVRLVSLELLAILYLLFWLALTIFVSIVASSPGDSFAIVGVVWLMLQTSVFQPLASAIVAALVFPGETALQIANNPQYSSLNSFFTTLVPPYGVAEAIFGGESVLSFTTGSLRVNYILNSSIAFLQWLSYAFDDILSLCLSITLILVASHFLFSRMDVGG